MKQDIFIIGENPSTRKGQRRYTHCLVCGRKVRTFESRPRKFCSRECYIKSGLPKELGKYGFTREKMLGNKYRKGIRPWSYLDGRSNHPRCRKIISVNGKQVQEAHFVWCNEEENLSYVPKGFVIHHSNLNPNDNSEGNLLLLPDIFHRQLHNQIIKLIKMEVN